MPEKKKTQKKKAAVKKKEKIEEKTEEKAEEKKTEDAKEILPPLDFSSIVLPFYTQAVIKLGLVEDPLSDKTGENLELAKRLIDLLDLLKEKTKENLETDEEKFLAACLHQLKMAYMEKAQIIKS